MIKFIKLNENAKIPKLAKAGDAGFDLAAITDQTIYSGERRLISTGISVEMPPNARGDIRGRSGLAVRHGIGVLGGVIDSGYRGEILVCLINHGDQMLEVKSGDRIAQIVFSPTITDSLEWAGTVSETERGATGFGSSG